MDAAAAGRLPDGLPSQAELVDQVLTSLETDPEPGLPTGFTDLDEAITGMFAGELIIVGARPGVGKSIAGYSFATYAGVKLGLPVLFCSLEMSAAQLTERLIAAQAKVPMTRIRKHDLDDADWLRVRGAHTRMTASKVRIDDTPHASLAHIRARLREMSRTEPARLLVVDYLGLLAEPKGTEGRRETAVAALSRGLKLIAREFAIPVVALAQLNRNAESRPGRRPQLADLRESGAQEQDADIVLLLHREDAYERESPRAGEIDVVVAKQRQGPQCTVTLAFQGHYARMVDMAPAAAHADDGWTPTRVLERAG
jgi:replicative DNA helicase